MLLKMEKLQKKQAETNESSSDISMKSNTTIKEPEDGNCEDTQHVSSSKSMESREYYSEKLGITIENEEFIIRKWTPWPNASLIYVKERRTWHLGIGHTILTDLGTESIQEAEARIEKIDFEILISLIGLIEMYKKDE